MTAPRPALDVAGVIEGFYGTPWTHAQRLDMIAFLGEVGMNTYVYAPKDDPFMRRRWREPYGAEQLAALAELVAACRAAGVRFQYALSPGLSMRYSLAADRALVLAKLEQVRDLGVDAFALLLDDIPADLQHAADRASFGSLVEAQGALVSEVHSRLVALDPGVRFAVCPTEYWGRGDSPYLRELGLALDPAIDLYWTGRAICSPELTGAEAELFRATTGRSPLYWDNFPVNDVAMTGELHLGPYLGRGGDLLGRVRGVIVNPMPLAEASKVAITTAADFCADPEGFDPEASWEAALRRVAGPRDAVALRELADAFRGSALCADDSPRLAAALERFAFDYEFGERPEALGALRAHVAEMAAAASALGGMENEALLADVGPWLDQYQRGLRLLSWLLDSLPDHGTGTAPELHGDARREGMIRLEEFRAQRRRAFGDALDMFVSDTLGEFRP